MECHKWIFFTTPKILENQLWPVSAYDNTKALSTAPAERTPAGAERSRHQLHRNRRGRTAWHYYGCSRAAASENLRRSSTVNTDDGLDPRRFNSATTRAPTRDNYGRLARRERSVTSSHRGRLQLPAMEVCPELGYTTPSHSADWNSSSN